MPTILEQLGVALPIIQAPMAGVSTAELAAAVSNAGALGSISVGATDAARARIAIADVRALTDRPFNVNAFVHAPPKRDPEREANWLAALAPYFHTFGAAPPASLRTIYTSFNEDDEMLAALVEAAPAVVSFHFGLPDAHRIAALKRPVLSSWRRPPISRRLWWPSRPGWMPSWPRASRPVAIVAVSIPRRRMNAWGPSLSRVY